MLRRVLMLDRLLPEDDRTQIDTARRHAYRETAPFDTDIQKTATFVVTDISDTLFSVKEKEPAPEPAAFALLSCQKSHFFVITTKATSLFQPMVPKYSRVIIVTHTLLFFYSSNLFSCDTTPTQTDREAADT